MTTSPKLGFTYLEENQASAEVSINEALNIVEATNQAVVLDRNLSAAPGSPANGDMYLVTGTPGGGDAWEGQTGKLALYYDGWYFVPVFNGLVVYVSDEALLLLRTGGEWVDIGTTTTVTRPLGLQDLGSGFSAGFTGTMVFTTPSVITGYTLIANASANLEIEIRKATLSTLGAGTPIAPGGSNPKLVAAQQSQDLALTGWTTGIAANDVYEFYIVGSPSGFTWASLSLEIEEAI
jgi:hypothetical protein